MKTNITKGEWIITDNTEQNIFRYLFIKCNNRRICDVKMAWQKEGQANAKLISASPIMLEALQGLMKTIPLGFSNEYTDLARQAIKKATE